MIKIGMVIGDRYEILESIGAGGMSDVYKAKDRKLNRFVALKVLKKEFSENKDFVSKFRTEAQAAAGLEHQNIVNVYDVGEEDGIYYIVMELVEGITLKRYIEKKQRLSVKESVSIAIQISMGLEAAHNNGIVHRDIKPQNIMISKDGKVKVTDFGIAKATSSNTITSNVMGSVHYASPEQARGGFSDAKSDIYSLGITLFEMLTGRVPFNGETAVAIAIMQIQNEMPSPRKYVPEIPVSVEQIVLKCCQKSPDRRYQKMSELVEDLKKSLISPDEDFVKIDSIESKSATRNVTEKEREMIKRRSTGQGYSAEAISAAEAGGIALSDTERMSPRKKALDEGDRRGGKSQQGSSQRKGQAKPQPSNGKKSGVSSSQKSQNVQRSKQASKDAVQRTKNRSVRSMDDDDEDEDDSFVEKLKTVIIVVVAVLIGCVILYFAGYAMGIFGNGGKKINQNQNEEQTEKVPSVVNLKADEASKILRDSGFKTETVYEKAAGKESNTVISTEPAANEAIAKGGTVIIHVAMEGEGVAVPSVVGEMEAIAVSKLEGEGFKVDKVEEYNSGIVKGNVISQSPEANSLMSRGGTVTITISKGADKSGELKMPSLTNMSEDAAKNTLANMELVCSKVTEVYSENVAEGLVCEQSITSGATVTKGTEVEIKISKGPEKKYYNCDITVSQPPKYVGGAAKVILKTPDGTELFNAQTDSFPVKINVNNIFAVSKGTVIVTYTVYIPEEVEDLEGNKTIQQVEAVDEYKYDVTFTDASN